MSRTVQAVIPKSYLEGAMHKEKGIIIGQAYYGRLMNGSTVHPTTNACSLVTPFLSGKVLCITYCASSATG